MEDSGARPCIILEWLEGRTLAQKLADENALSLCDAVWVARQCAEGLLCLAGAGYAHGDVKPSNVMLTGGGRVKLIDLAFARPIDGNEAAAHSRILMGTADYMAPEVLSRGSYHPVQRDLYSLGVMLFRMIAGRLPFLAENAAEMLRLQRQMKPPRLADFQPGIPVQLDDLVGRLLSKQPIRRPQSITAVVRELVGLELAQFSRIVA
jgi:serine/threonine-protein kinase